MSFLEVFDRAAGATKCGGTTRRAAKMVCLDMDHPEIEDFIDWKVREEKKAHALIAAGFSSDFNGEAYHTVSGQNSNNSVRVTDDFMRPSIDGRQVGRRTARTTGEVAETLRREAISGTRSPRPRGPAPTRACSTTRRSTAGTPARTRTGSTRRTRAPSTCSSTTRPATCRAINLQVPAGDDGTLRRRGLPPRLPRFLLRRRKSSSISRATRRRAIAQELARLPPARPRLREPGHAAHAARRAVRQRRGPRDVRRRSPRSCAAHAYASSAEIAGVQGAVRRLSPRTASRCCA